MNILLIGNQGKMGKLFCEIISQSKTDRIVACVDIKNSESSTMPYLCGKEHKTIWSVKEKCDIIVDFSTLNNKSELIDFALLNKVPLAIFSTTCSETDIEALQEASKHIPVLVCSNTSVGIKSMLEAIEILSRELVNADIVVTEYHHKNKVDVPSGTAKNIIETLSKKGLKISATNTARVGSECGEHIVQFFMEDEVVTISHRANSRKVFAIGAFEMVKKLRLKNCGFYTQL